MTGAIASAPSTASLYSTSLQEFLGLNFQATYGATKAGMISIAATDPLNPFVLSLEGIVAGRVFGMRLISGDTMQVKITTALGVASVPVSDELVIHSPNPGDEFTAIAFVGTGDVRYFIAGDVD